MYFTKILVTPNATGERENEWKIYRAVWKKTENRGPRYRIEGQYKRGGSLFASGYLNDLIDMLADATNEAKRWKTEINYVPGDEVKGAQEYVKEQRRLAYMLKLAVQHIQAQGAN